MPSIDFEVSGMTTGRITALTDGIFAVAMTLLVLNLKLPQGGAEGVEADLLGLITGQGQDSQKEPRRKFFIASVV